MLRLNPAQRAVLVDKVPDVSNIVAGALVIGFFFGQQEASWRAVVAALAGWAAVLAFAVWIARE